MPNKATLEAKQKVVSELAEEIKNSVVGILVDYKGISVAQDTQLRKQLRESGDNYKVVKNTLLKLALEQAGIEGLEPVLEGTTALATSTEDYTKGAKVIDDFMQKEKVLAVKAGFIDGAKIDASQVKELATMPSKEVLISKMLGSMNAPITGFVTVLNGTMKGLAVALNAIAEKKGAEAPAEA